MTFNIRAAFSASLVGAGLVGGCVALVATGLAVPAQAASPVLSGTPQPRPDFVVFFENGSRDLSPAASSTIRIAAKAARAKHAAIVRVVGRGDHAQAVKAELVRQGVPATAIVFVGRDESQPLIKAADGVAEPSNRQVRIAF
jgi:outer membrane protein OmpA-like peptidoglycan-associated protein